MFGKPWGYRSLLETHNCLQIIGVIYEYLKLYNSVQNDIYYY